MELVGKKPQSFTEIFEQALPYYLSIGMSLAEYWEGENILVKWYYEAHKLKVEQENEKLWLQGQYNLRALEVVISNAFGKKGKEPLKYYKEPIRITPLTEEEKAKKAAEQRAKLIADLNAWQKRWEAEHGN